jgi:hypothetical protein
VLISGTGNGAADWTRCSTPLRLVNDAIREVIADVRAGNRT